MELATTGPRVLIAYFSRTGNTARVARCLAHAYDVELEAIQASIGRSGPFGYLLSGYEAMFGREARIRPPLHAPRDYDIVLIGTPTWSGSIASPVRSYLTRFAGSFPEVGFFVTSGGDGAERVFSEMESLARKMPLGRLALTRRDFKGRWSVRLAEFWEAVLCGWESRALAAQ
ncbi:MAG TPA: hypothetical protein VNW92_14800 [Polyangiaceae bacterium]|jgi:flavodoxin|nr:hypothetical protein [Polyangiaceae bacterium]